MRVGYARVSTAEQNLNLQRDALQKADCERVFEDTESGVKAQRPGLSAALDYLREGDALVVWRLDRLGRSLGELIALVKRLEERGVGLVSLTESLDTTTAAERLVFHVFGALAEFERNLIRERTAAGLMAARSRGRRGGRPRKLTGTRAEMARRLSKEKSLPVRDICALLGVSRSTYYLCLQDGQAASPDG